MPEHRTLAFGPFTADTVTRRLWREQQLVPITAKTFDVLMVLLEHRDRLVTKDELLDRVWPDTAVQENNLARQVSSLRRALGQPSDQAEYILTVPGQGYRFVGTAKELTEVPPYVGNGTAAVPPPVPDAAPDVDLAVPSRLFRVPLPVAAAAVLAALALGAALLSLNSTRPDTRRALQRITYDDTSLPRDASWSPDGKSIVFASDRGGNTDLWQQRIGNPDPVPLTTSEAAESQPQWSPDGRWIVFRSERDGGGLFVMRSTGGDERMVANFGYEPTWAPDSTRVLFKRSVILPDLPTIYVVGLDGMPARPVRPDVLGRFTSLQAAWHPDGRVSVWGTAEPGVVRFVNVPLQAGTAAPLELPAAVRRDLEGIVPGRFTWAPSRRYIYFEGRAGDTRNLWRVAVDAAGERLTEGPERLTTSAGEETHIALSPDGTKALFTSSSTRTRLWAFPLDAATGRVVGAPEPITQGSTAEVDFDARTDGSKVAYRAVRAGRNELWERSVGEGRERLLVSSPDWKLVKPRWSPDGARLAFLRCRTRGDTPVLALLNTDGSGERALTRPDEIEMLASDWSNDGEWILGSCRFNSADRYSTCAMPVSNGGRVRVIASDPKRNLFNQRYSPDQKWIAFLAHDLMYSSTSTVYVTPAGGGAWRALTDGATFDDKPRWGPDGRVLYYVSNRGGVKNVWARRFDAATGAPAGEPFPVTAFRSPQFVMSSQAVQMDIAVTATRLLIPMTESRSDIWMLDRLER